ncbi:MAG: hypothetical protein JW951_01040 [Lentisphaerae bacterium]|nr:hypothetical protein [Lentisphaerota bacterium]
MKKLTGLLLILGALGALRLAGGLQDGLLERQAAMGPRTVEPLRDAPPLLAFNTIVLGGFRGLIADMLWLRASYLQDEGRTLELVQLAEWITKLEPHATEVWAFHAWNLAYNVSIMMAAPQDRWRWVLQGVALLRDDGLRYNPGDPRLYAELAWLFYHKIGGKTDRAHPYYQAQWRREMTAVLGEGRPDYAVLEADPGRLRRLREDYRLDPDRMRAIEARYGPLDWTRADAQAVYWAEAGRRRAGGAAAVPCERMIVRALARQVYDLYESGRIEQARAVFERMAARFGLPEGIASCEAFVEAYGARR